MRFLETLLNMRKLNIPGLVMLVIGHCGFALAQDVVGPYAELVQTIESAARPMLTAVQRNHQRNHFCVIGYAEDTGGGGEAAPFPSYFVHWREGRQLIQWEGVREIEWSHEVDQADVLTGVVDADLLLVRRRNQLGADTVETSDELAGSTYLVTRTWWNRVVEDCVAHGSSFVIDAFDEGDPVGYFPPSAFHYFDGTARYGSLSEGLLADAVNTLIKVEDRRRDRANTFCAVGARYREGEHFDRLWVVWQEEQRLMLWNDDYAQGGAALVRATLDLPLEQSPPAREEMMAASSENNRFGLPRHADPVWRGVMVEHCLKYGETVRFGAR